MEKTIENNEITENRVRHLELVQSVISRMASNSFLIRGWTVTLVAALFALAAKDAEPKFAIIAILPAICFWGLDGYYLRQERMFRSLYKDVICKNPVSQLFSLDKSNFSSSVDSLVKTIFSGVTLAFHLPVLAAVIAAIFIF